MKTALLFCSGGWLGPGDLSDHSLLSGAAIAGLRIKIIPAAVTFVGSRTKIPVDGSISDPSFKRT